MNKVIAPKITAGSLVIKALVVPPVLLALMIQFIAFKAGEKMPLALA